HLMVRVRDAETVDRAAPSGEALLAVLRTAGAEGCYVYAFDPASPNTAYARFFNPTVGLWEDAATGTAAGPLCAYLGAEGLLNSGKTLVVEQGVKMGRRSLLQLGLTPDRVLSSCVEHSRSRQSGLRVFPSALACRDRGGGQQITSGRARACRLTTAAP